MLDRKSRMSREVPVRFCEGGGVKFPSATRRNIYVRSERAGQRVMESVKSFLSRRLRLKVNDAKSAGARPDTRKFLGFSFTAGREPKRRL
jgi:retron-type reverse transcriptase